MSEWGFADMYAMDANEPSAKTTLEDVKSTDWRNILVLGRATSTGVYPETLALVGRARYMADELGCRVEVALIGEDLEAATESLKRYAIDTIYRVPAPTYAPIDQTAKILEQIVRKRRPELVLVFQSRTGDAVTAYAANRLGVGFLTGASKIDIDTMARRARVVHQGANKGFQIVSDMNDYPQFVSVQRGMFRAPMEDPYANVQVHDVQIDVGKVAQIQVLESGPPAQEQLSNARKVLVVGARVCSKDEVEKARHLADRLGAVFGVTLGIVERGLAETKDIVGEQDTHIAPELLITVGVRGSLDFLQAIASSPTIAALGCDATDPIAQRADFVLSGEVDEGLEAVLAAI